jgi:hypothetical protein
MAVQTDKTLEDWGRAVTALGAETSILIRAAVIKARRDLGASSEVEADAMPHAFLAVWRNGLSPEHAARMAVRSLHYTAQAKAADPDFVSLDDVETSAQRDALEAAVHAAGLGRDDVARSYGGGSRGSLMSLTEALEMAPTGAAAIVSAVIRDGLTRKVPVRNVETVDASGSSEDDVMALHGGVKDRRTRTGQYRPLKVSVVAAAAGVARPRTKAASAVLTLAGCKSYAMVQAIRDESESVESLTAQALAYVTRDRRAYGGNGQAVWQRDARPESVEYALYRPMSDFQPDLSTPHVAPLQPVRGHRANTGSKGRKGPQAGQPSADTSHGASAARTPGTLFSATGGPNDAGLTAKRSDRADRADLAAHEAQDARAQGTACTAAHSHSSYAVRVFAVDVNGVSIEHVQGSPHAAVCGCGPTKGQALILGMTRTGLGWCHALTVCPAPKVSDAQRVTCGCGRKRGSLTARGEHRAR